MKILLLLFLVGCATASFHQELDDAAEEVYHEFMLGLESAGSFEDSVGYGHPILRKAEEEVKTELGRKLQETLDEILKKIKDSVEKGKEVKEDVKQKLKEVKEKLKELKKDIGGKARDLIEKIKEKAKEFWNDLLDKLKQDKKRSVQKQHIDFNFKDMFKKLKDLLLQKIDKEKLKAKVEELFGKGSEMADSLLKMINEKGDKYKQKLLDLVDRYLGKDEKRSIKEVWEKVKDYFKDLHIDIKEKYMKFGEWVKDVVGKGKMTGKDKLENLKNIAQEFVDHVKGIHKDVAAEALEFLRPYKDDLGSLWDQVKEAAKDIFNRKD